VGFRTSLLIPCYNESPGIPQLCERLKALELALDPSENFEVVFVDDGSTDGTSETIARSMNGLPHQVIRHARNRGIGAAIRTGLAAAKGDEIVTIDSDCTYDPMTIPGILQLLRSGYDVVTASPYHPDGEVVGVEHWRLVISKILSHLYALVLPQRLHTYTSCYRAYRRDVLGSVSLTNDGFLGVTEILVSGILCGVRVGEFPVRLTRRLSGHSKINVMSVSLAHLRYLGTIIGKRVFTRSTPLHHDTIKQHSAEGTTQ
jgi:dolichol-phosphate mannosyltransferase